ncbi:hypothetical protein [Aquibacillus saliphilus]|uniref:hypothetical protein n=1 Tax=Aquibacillus saliphilus TaxID=1909422 RepID=UPI001CEFDBF8|nr:hypothetical protein [Aquibacillus saliphilus]
MSKRFILDYAETPFQWVTIAECDNDKQLQRYLNEEKSRFPHMKYRLIDTESFKYLYQDVV